MARAKKSAKSRRTTKATAQPLRIGIVAGELSGDILGAGLIEALRKQSSRPIEFAGIGGPRMLAAGFDSRFDIDRLAVMGLVEPLKRLPELLRMRRTLRAHFLAWRADIVIGIDSPDFNLGLELWLRQRGIRTAHYVSPSVWAWRQGRIRKIRRAVDLMLTLFPFEAQFYRDHQVPVVFVGHPLADELPLQIDVDAARAQLDISGREFIVAMLPGSRAGEIEQMLAPFVDAAQWLLQHHQDIIFLIPAANEARFAQLETALRDSDLPIRLLQGQSHLAMAAADVVLMTSGTTTLEAMLLKKPMVVAYRMGRLSWLLLRRLVKTPFVSLPNLVAGRALVPELLQDDVRGDVIGRLLLERLDDHAQRQQLQREFHVLHEGLRRNASEMAAKAVLDVIRRRK